MAVNPDKLALNDPVDETVLLILLLTNIVGKADAPQHTPAVALVALPNPLTVTPTIAVVLSIVEDAPVLTVPNVIFGVQTPFIRV